jgi:enoyl-CoA hydratase
MGYENILLNKEDKISIITINRPESLNALMQNNQRIKFSVERIRFRPILQSIILTGSGEKSFVAGADIKEFSDFGQEKAEELARNGHNTLFNKIENMTKPVIAAVNGFALGGGLELAMACHIRYASENAKLGLPEVTLGLIPGYGGKRLPKLVGKGIANEMIFSAKMIPAAKAKEIGLVNEVYPIEELLNKTKELANYCPQFTNGNSKAIQAVNLSDTDKGFETEIKYFGELFEMDDKKEGVSAFLEKESQASKLFTLNTNYFETN